MVRSGTHFCHVVHVILMKSLSPSPLTCNKSYCQNMLIVARIWHQENSSPKSRALAEKQKHNSPFLVFKVIHG